MKIFKIIVILVLTSFSSLFAQSGYRVCDTENMVKKALQQDPNYAIERAKLNQFTSAYEATNSALKSSKGVPLYTIPVVVHVIHNYGYENIPKSQILDAIEHLNKSFQNLWDDSVDVNPPFKPIIADCQIEFKLAQIDPNGNCTDGITRTVSSLTYTASDNVKPLSNWPSNKYFNIWVVQDIASGAAGYAYYPGINPSVDGVVIRADYFGVGSNYAIRSMTHEAGHWLNLPHTWGSTNDPGLPQNCSNDDFVSDTPNTIGVANFSCNYNQITCNSLDNVENYMDYAGCHYMFTQGQKLRMHAALNSSQGGRNNLHTGNNLIATGTDLNYIPVACIPQADFNKDARFICEGSSVNFKDYTWKGDPTTWQWDFPGGTPSSSTDQNPVITYNTAGTYDVTLTVTNSAGSDTYVASSIINVSPATGQHSIPYYESFETITFPGTEWLIDNEAGNTWQLTTTAAKTGSNSVRIINHSGNGAGTIDALVTPGYDLTNIINATMTFELAFAVRSTSSTDQLKVYASSTCGEFWAIRYTKSGTALSTAGLVSASFVPTANQWRQETVNLNSVSYNNKPNIRFKFEYTQNSGNNIYIDDINITGTSTVGIQDVEFLATVNIYPNPSASNATTDFKLSEPNLVKVDILDISGRTVSTIANGYHVPGNYTYQISNEISAGTYFIRYTIGSNTITKKFIKL